MEKKKNFWTYVWLHLINIGWSALWALVCAGCLYAFLPQFIDMSSDDLTLISVILGIVVFVAVWVANYADTKNFINRL